MKTSPLSILLVLFVLMLNFGALMEIAYAQTIITVDQEMTDTNWPDAGAYSINFMAPMGQEFRPNLSGLNAVELFLQDFDQSDGLGATVRVHIRKDTIYGSIVGTSNSVSVPSLPNPPSQKVVHFDFDYTVPLVPGDRYVIEIEQLGGGNFGIKGFGGPSDPYPYGRQIALGSPSLDGYYYYDLWFREGISDSLELVGLEVIQTIQDWENSVPLIEGKTTWVRAHVQTTDSSERRIRARLRGFRDGIELPGSPLHATIIARPDAADRRDNWGDSLNFWLPPEWRHGVVKLYFEGLDCEIDCQKATDMDDNCSLEVVFNPTSILKVMLVAVSWIDTSLTTHTPTTAELAEEAQRLKAIYPIARLDWTTGSFLLPDLGPPNLTILNARLELGRLLNCVTAGDCKRFYYGVIVDAMDLGGLAGGIPSMVASGDMGAERNVHAHELGHCLGRHHAVNEAHFGTTTGPFGTVYKNGACGSVASIDAPDFPYIFTIGNFEKPTIGPMDLGENRFIYGLDTHRMLVLNPNDFNFELMSYCRDLWISDYTYKAIDAAINELYISSTTTENTAAGSTIYDYLLFRGTINFQNDSVEFLPFVMLSSEMPLEIPTQGDYILKLLDDSNNLIMSIPFQPKEYVGFGNELETGSFLIPIQADPSIRKAVIYHDGAFLALQLASDYPPMVEVLYPNGGESFSGEQIMIEWTANDLDGDDLVYIVQYSSDAGSTWETLVVDWPYTNYEIDREYLTATNNGLVRVMVSDGFNTTTDESDGIFTVLNNAPHVFILTPEQYSVFTGEQLIFFEAATFDREDGQLSGASLAWTSNIDGLLGIGGILTRDANGLTEGYHEITVTVTDSGGLIDTASVNIWVFQERPTNIAPIAVAGPNQVVYAWIGGMADVVLDGNDSNDPDGDELSYYWSWIVEGDVYHANGVSPAIELPVGEYVIELIVNDGYCDSESDYVDVNVIGPVEAQLRLFPKALVRHAKGPKYLLTFLTLPEGIDRQDIIDDSLRLYPADSNIGLQASYKYIYTNRRGIVRCLAIFEKGELLELITADGLFDLNLVGQFTTGQYFYGTDSVKIITRRWRRWRRWFGH